ncbi:transposase [Bacillota bacterium Lsc_1132]
MKRNRYTPEFKSQIVLEFLKEEKAMSEIASNHGVHVNQIRQWKNVFLNQMPQIFTNESKKTDKVKEDYEKQIENLYAEVCRLTTQLS